jgi:hypothetical protein
MKIKGAYTKVKKGRHKGAERGRYRWRSGERKVQVT